MTQHKNKPSIGLLLNARKMLALGVFLSALFVFFGPKNVSATCSVNLATPGEVGINVLPGNANIATSNVVINTDCSHGYSLYIGGPNNSTLYKNGDSTSLDYISVSSGTVSSPAAITGNNLNTYGYSTDANASVSSSSFIGITNGQTLLYNKESASVVGGDNIPIVFGASVSGDKPVGLYTMADNGAIVYYAIAAEVYTVTFDANGGSIPAGEDWEGSGDSATKDVVPESTYGALPTPTRNGYTFLGWNRNNLPIEYQELTYVKFNTGNYIDTGIIPTNHMTEIKFDYETYTNDEFLLGTSQGSDYYYTSSYNDRYAFGHDGHKSWTSYGAWTTGDHHLIYNGDNNEIVLDGELLESGFGISATTTLWIGRRGSTINLDGKVYYAKVVDKTTGELVRNYVPCYNKQTGVTGFYEMVEGVFYTNSGSGLLSRGPEVPFVTSSSALIADYDHTLFALWGKNPTITFETNDGDTDIPSKTVAYGSNYGELPIPMKDGYEFLGWSAESMSNDYQEVEYISLSGTQYVDTNYALWKDPNWKIEYKFDVSQFYDYDNMFGSLGTSSTDNEIWINSGKNYYIRFNNIGKTAIASLELNTPYTMTHDNTGGSLMNYINGTPVSSLSKANTSFSPRLGFGHREGSHYLKGKIYYLKFWSNGALVRDMVPCYKKIGGTIGMCDMANEEFYPNAGSGIFGKGEDVSSFISDNDELITNSDHTLYAVWNSPKYTIDVIVNNGTVDVASRDVYENSSGIFNLIPSLNTYISLVSCTNGQKASISNDVLTVENVTDDTICTVTYSDPGSTVLYTDGTLIINEKLTDRAQNILDHGAVTNEYAPFSNTDSYVFSSTSSALWYNQRGSIKRIEIGQRISPTDTKYWFRDEANLTGGDFSNLDTSNVTSMHQMFCNSGESTSVTSFILTGLEDWDTSKVTTMSSMFEDNGHYATTWDIGDLSGWDTSKVENMNYMFYYAGYNASTSLTSIGTLKVYATSVYQMFNYSRYMKATLDVYSNPASGSSGYDSMFSNAANQVGALITVNHGCDTYNIDNMVATKSSSSHVVRGVGIGECTANVIVDGGTVDVASKQIGANSDTTFTIVPTNIGAAPAVTCNHGQVWSVNGNILTLTNITLNTDCNVYFEDVTVLYNDGTLIINEDTSDRLQNITDHGGVKNIYVPFGIHNYVFSSDTNVLWYNQRSSINSVEIGKTIAPTDTKYWFSGLTKMMTGDFTNLDTSNVTKMNSMFSSAGNNSSMTGKFELIGLDNWNTEKVTTMASMFENSGRYAKEWSIGDLSGWDTGLVTNMSNMFNYAANNASTSMTSIGALEVHATNIYRMFYYSKYMQATVNIYSNPASGKSGYNEIFSNAVTQTGALITVNYSSATTNIDNIINTKSSSSNVVKGNQLD